MVGPGNLAGPSIYPPTPHLGSIFKNSESTPIALWSGPAEELLKRAAGTMARNLIGGYVRWPVKTAEDIRMTTSQKVALAISIPLLLWALATAGAQQDEQITVDTSHVVNSFSPLRALGGAIDIQHGGQTQEAISKHVQWEFTDPR